MIGRGGMARTPPPDRHSDPARPGATIASVDVPETELPEPQFPELRFPELKLPPLELSTPLANPEEIPDPQPELGVPGAASPASPLAGATGDTDAEAVAVAGFNRQDVLSCARDAFAHLQAAVSLSEPDRCRVYVTEEVGQAVRHEVESLSARGRRRVRGDLEILDASVIRVDSPERVGVRIDAVSSLCEMDERDKVVEGSPDLVRWGQELTMSRDHAGPVARRWLISALGPLAVGGAVTGPAAPPMDAAERRALEDRIEHLDRESDEHEAGLMRVASSDLIHPGTA